MYQVILAAQRKQGLSEPLQATHPPSCGRRQRRRLRLHLRLRLNKAVPTTPTLVTPPSRSLRHPNPAHDPNPHPVVPLPIVGPGPSSPPLPGRHQTRHAVRRLYRWVPQTLDRGLSPRALPTLETMRLGFPSSRQKQCQKQHHKHQHQHNRHRQQQQQQQMAKKFGPEVSCERLSALGCRMPATAVILPGWGGVPRAPRWQPLGLGTPV